MWQKPIVEIRVEEYERGTLPRFLSVYKEIALPILVREVGRPLACYTTNVGRINCLTQLFAYDSLADFERRQAAVEADAGWAEYLQAAQGIIRYRNTRLTRRIGFPLIDGSANLSYRKPVIDLRTYHIRFNQMPTFLRTTQEFALDVMVHHIGPPIGYYLNVAGNLQQITHLWGYDSMGDMETRRLARNADPDWQKYLDASDGIYERQETQVLVKLKLFDDEQ